MRIGPSVGNGTLLPVAKPVKQKRGKSLRTSKPRPPRRPIPPEPETFTLQLIRPVGLPPTEEKRRTVSMQQNFDLPPPGCAPEHILIVRLERGDPYELWFNGRLAGHEKGQGWRDRERSVLTIRATRSAGLVGRFTPIGVHEPVDGHNTRPILLVPVSALHTVFMELDGRELVNMPAPQQKGGQHQ